MAVSMIVIIAIIIVIIAAFAIAFFSGAISIEKPTAVPTVKSAQEASEITTEISSGIDEIGSILEEIDKSIG